MKSFEQVVLLVVSGQGLLLSLALLTSVIKKKYSSFFLGLITLVISLEILNAWGMQVGYHGTKNPFPFWSLGSYLIVPPALLLFTRANTLPKFQLRPWHFLLFLPAAIEVVAEFSIFYANRLAGTDYHLIQNPFWFAFTELLPVAAMGAVLVMYWKSLQSIGRQLRELAIQKSFLHMLKLYSFFILFSLLTVLWFMQGMAGVQVFPAIKVILVGFLFVLGYVGYFHPAFFDTPQLLKGRITKEEFPRYDDSKELARLLTLFENSKVYTRPRLSLDELARELNLPPRYLSALINSYHATDFRNFVNSYRVKEVIARIRDPKESHKTLLAIAMEAGFSSKSSFNQIFKAVTGQTPSNYLIKVDK